jgi:hypothetical protein
MKRLFLVAALGLTLGGCAALPSVNLSSAVAMNTVYGVENAYGVAIAAANTYKSLPLCQTGTVISFTNPCAKRSLIVRLQASAARARTAVNNMVAFQKAYPTVDVTNVLSAAQAAVQHLQQTLAGAQ